MSIITRPSQHDKWKRVGQRPLGNYTFEEGQSIANRIVSNSDDRLCLKNLAMFFNNLVCLAVKQIIQFFYLHLSVGCIYLIVYVDDIVLTGSDHHDIS